jgi:transposase InsO family protein
MINGSAMSQTSDFSRTGAIRILVHLLPKTELLNGEIFYTLKEAKIVIENWRSHYNTARPHSSLGYRPPAPAALVWPAPKEIVKMQSLN